ncbi:MAG: sigma-70 family RNA polymerase sigma factor [Dehalococcoidales bacterium]|nr:sigma-70 family RNA polymerase sigma factor [Dehalococcoidales bacterium]
MQDEGNLVRQAQEGDEQAFGRLYEEYFDKIYRYISIRVGDTMEAEDMTQQVFLNALKSISSFQWKGVPFSAWLYRIAHNQVVDHLRKKTRQPGILLNEPLADSRGSNPQLLVEHSMDVEQLLLATKRLTEAQREVISLRFSSGLSIKEVARIMGKNQGAVKALQHSAILALRKILVAGNNEEVQRI